MMKLICIVNGMRLQKPSPNAFAASNGEARRHVKGGGMVRHPSLMALLN